MQLDKLVNILRQVEQRLAAPVKFRFFDRMVHDLGDHDTRRRRRVGIHVVKPAKRQECFLERIRAGDVVVQVPRDFHLAARCLAKHKPVVTVADLRQAFCWRAVDQQVISVHPADRHAELHPDHVERLHRQPSRRVGSPHVRRIVIGMRVRPAIAIGGFRERVGSLGLVGDAVILRPGEVHLALGQAGELKHPCPAAALDRLRRLAVCQQVGGINAVHRLAKCNTNLTQIRGQAARRINRLHFWRDTLD